MQGDLALLVYVALFAGVLPTLELASMRGAGSNVSLMDALVRAVLALTFFTLARSEKRAS